jgi:hypothetical protein
MSNRRKYFKNSSSDGLSKASTTFLLKFIDEKDNLKTVGPFAQEDDAFEALSSYLKSGVCSWIVSYNG